MSEKSFSGSPHRPSREANTTGIIAKTSAPAKRPAVIYFRLFEFAARSCPREDTPAADANATPTAAGIISNSAAGACLANHPWSTK